MTTATPSQRRLPLKVELDAPLVSLATAVAALGLDGEIIRDLVSVQTLAWAWNIGLGGRKEEVRILSRCLAGYQNTGESCNLGAKREEEIIAWILAREKKPWIEGVHVKFILACESDHVNHLVDAGELTVMPGSQRSRGGSGGSNCDKVTRQSLDAFFKRRRIINL